MTSTCRLILVRHGETDWNVARRLQGHTDIALNARGEQQAEAVARALQDEPIEAIYASDLLRAWRTAECIASRHGHLTLTADPRLRERSYGLFEGLRTDELAIHFPDAVADWGGDVLSLVPPEGELRRDFHDRIAGCLTEIAARHAGQSICVVAHGGVLDVAHRMAHGVAFDTVRQWTIVNAGINRLTIDAGRFSLLSWGEAAHLEDVA